MPQQLCFVCAHIRLNVAKIEYYSDILCPRLRESDGDYEDSENALVHTLTFACEKVFEKTPNVIVDLDQLLRKQNWKIFKRLRQHLYAQYPNEQTKPLIRELILEYENYHQFQYGFEFQQMISRACEFFGETLLTTEERTQIFDAIHSGPPKESYSEGHFKQRQRYLHRVQLRPFAPVLFGEYETYFLKLESETNDQISDEDYPPYKRRSGWVSHQSPRSPNDLANLIDEDLLTYINEWKNEDKIYRYDEFVEINIEALAEAVGTVFKESIIPNTNRLKFWMDNRDKIQNPIYVQKIIYAMQAYIKEKNFDQLNDLLTFCEWVLSHPGQDHSADYKISDESRENQNWSNERRTVRDFIGVCLAEDIDTPITARGQLAKILETLCTEFDSRLDQNSTSNAPIIDAFTEGLNSTRGRALEDLVKFGSWLRKHNSNSDISEITTILEKRFAKETECPLTLPEYAVLGRNYYDIFSLDATWTAKYKTDFFPQENLPAWLAAFSSLVDYGGLLYYSDTSHAIFDILQHDFDFALQHLSDFKKQDRPRQETIDRLGQHLFTYYLWNMYPLKGQESLLERYYKQTNNAREYWANLFNDIGYRLRNSGKDLDPNLKNRIIAFFEWRFEEKEETELQQFSFWLEAECLEAEWRLKAYSKVLNVCEVETWGIHLKTLCEMLPNYTDLVVDCFYKLTKVSKKDNIYIRQEEANTILSAGYESSDESVQQKAGLARENLLNAGIFVLSELED